MPSVSAPFVLSFAGERAQAGSSAKAGMISQVNHWTLSREPQQLMIAANQAIA